MQWLCINTRMSMRVSTHNAGIQIRVVLFMARHKRFDILYNNDYHFSLFDDVVMSTDNFEDLVTIHKLVIELRGSYKRTVDTFARRARLNIEAYC